MKVCVIASGSKGNMTYVESKNTRILIDAGISISNAQERKPEIDFKTITDVLVTHEHIDHIQFLDTVIKKTNANLYISKKSFVKLKDKVKDNLVGRKIGFIDNECKYRIGDVEVLTLSLLHDTENTLGFIIVDGESKFGYFTDTGIFPTRYKNLLSDLNCFVIEANHNIEMLQNSNRDYFLINRILSPQGHMSNKACYELLNEVLTDKNKCIILSHVSEDCNSNECLETDIINKLTDYKGEIIIAEQNNATKIIEF